MWQDLCYHKSIKKNEYIQLPRFDNKININSLIEYPLKTVYVLARIAESEYIVFMAGPLQKYSENKSIYFREILSSECKLKEYSNPKSVIIHIYSKINPIYSLYSDNSLCVLYDVQIWFI